MQTLQLNAGPGCLSQVVPGSLSAQHTAVQGIPASVIAGVPAEFAILPSDQFGNRGAAGAFASLNLVAKSARAFAVASATFLAQHGAPISQTLKRMMPSVLFAFPFRIFVVPIMQPVIIDLLPGRRQLAGGASSPVRTRLQ